MRLRLWPVPQTWLPGPFYIRDLQASLALLDCSTRDSFCLEGTSNDCQHNQLHGHSHPLKSFLLASLNSSFSAAPVHVDGCTSGKAMVAG